MKVHATRSLYQFWNSSIMSGQLTFVCVILFLLQLHTVQCMRRKQPIVRNSPLTQVNFSQSKLQNWKWPILMWVFNSYSIGATSKFSKADGFFQFHQAMWRTKISRMKSSKNVLVGLNPQALAFKYDILSSTIMKYELMIHSTAVKNLTKFWKTKNIIS